MSDYISRKTVLEAFEDTETDVCESYSDGYSKWGFSYETMREVVKSISSADVAPVVHGKWEWDTGDIYRCTACNEKAHVKEVMECPYWLYCPNCGAKMDG